MYTNAIHNKSDMMLISVSPELSSELHQLELNFVNSLLTGDSDCSDSLSLLLQAGFARCRSNGSYFPVFSSIRNHLLTLILQKAPYLEAYLWRNCFYDRCANERQYLITWMSDCEFLQSVLRRYLGFSQQHVREAARYIMQNPDGKHSLNTIADEIHLNSSYLSHLFHQEAGITLIRYMTEQKMNRAKVLLLNREMKIHEIAILLGYNEAEYFRKIFRNTCGLSPSLYKSQMLSQCEEA